MAKLKQKFFIQFGSSLLISIFGMVAGIVVARVGGPEVVGIISYGTAYVSVFGFITGLFGTGHIKLISEGQNLGDCMKTFIWLQGGSIVIYVLVVLSWFMTQKYFLHYSFESLQQQIIIILSLFVFVIGLIYQVTSVTFTATLHQVKANLPNLGRQFLYHIGRVVVVLFGYKALGLSLWALVSGIIVLPLVWHQFRQLPKGTFNKFLAKKYVSFAIPVFLIVIIDSLLNYSDKLMLSHYSNTIELGYYSAAHSIGGIFLLLSSVIGTIFFPLFSSLIAKNDWEAVNQKIVSFHEFVILFILPFACLMAIIANPFLITLLGVRYEPSVSAFILLLFSTFVSIIGMPYGNILNGMGKFYLSVWINITKLLIFFFTLTLFLSPRFLNLGATGLALNTLVMSLINNLFFLFFARKYGKLSYNKINAMRYILILFPSAIIFYFVKFISSWGVYWWVIIIPSYLLLIYCFLFITRLLKKHHLMMLIEVLNIKSTINYIKQELKVKNFDK